VSWQLDLQPVAGTNGDLLAALQAASLPTDDLTESGRSFFRLSDHGREVGFGGLEIYGQHALLRSVVVVPEHRGRGYGVAVTNLVLDQAMGHGVRTVYLLTDSATSFFEHLGFAQIDRAAAPAAILQTRQAASLCPASAALLAKTIIG
jgi:N-acetylglutamate synthase-like GNAT family acetyltransferase